MMREVARSIAGARLLPPSSSLRSWHDGHLAVGDPSLHATLQERRKGEGCCSRTDHRLRSCYCSTPPHLTKKETHITAFLSRIHVVHPSTRIQNPL
eukprot:scaffold16790_cov101-Isochrysis_galbana.AAC.5